MDISRREIIQYLEKEIAGRLSQIYGDKIDVGIDSITKVNQADAEAIVIRHRSHHIAPVIYTESVVRAIQDGEISINGAADRIIDLYNRNLREIIHQEQEPVWMDAKTNLFAEVVGTEANLKFLDDKPHRAVEDVSIICRYDYGNGKSFVLNYDAAARMGLESKEALQIAIQNSIRAGYKIRTLAGMLGEMSGMEMPIDGVSSTVLVITNEAGYRGAAGLFISSEIRQEIHDRMEGDYYILPSSIHECLVMKATQDVDAEELKAMVREINATQVAPEDRLTDQVYLVDSSLKIRIAGNHDEQMDGAEKLQTVVREKHQIASMHM